MNRAPTKTWRTRRDSSGSYVRTASDDQIMIVTNDYMGWAQASFMSRSEARLLAKRINECLDETVKR